jgi:hypothetical protein
MSSSSNKAIASSETSVYGRSYEADAEDDEFNENLEVILLTEIRLALSSMLHMLETCKENLILLGVRLDKLREASEKCRIAVQKQQSLRRVETSQSCTSDMRSPATDSC